jgi:tRNA(Ile)-lysidine synthase
MENPLLKLPFGRSLGNEDLFHRFRETIRQYGLVHPGERIIVGVSGGPDSVCLLFLMGELAPLLDLSIGVAHLNHGLRGNEAREDQIFVKSLAQQLGFPFYTETVNVGSFAKEKGLSKQVAGRHLRYQFFERIAEEIKAHRIAVGHTLDDQTETLLMRLLRGTGSDGFQGIPIVRNGTIIRPLLMVTRREIEAYLKEKNIFFREDSSNQESYYFRNRVRKELIPFLMNRFNPNFQETLHREAFILCQEGDYLEKEARGVFKQCSVRGEGEIRFEGQYLLTLHPGLRWRVFRMAIRRLASSEKEIEFKHIAAMDQLLRGPGMGGLHLPNGLRIEKEQGFLVVLMKESTQSFPWNFPLVVPGVMDIDFVPVKVFSQITDDQVETHSETVAVFDWEKIPHPLEVRNWQKGDFFYPKGLGGKKKLQDFFVDLKIPRSQRSKIPLLASPKGILWIMGLRLDGRFLADQDSKIKLVISIQKKG